MNPRFSYAWLRHLNSNRQRGFAMPMAMMLGLVMVVVGVTLLVQSTGNQTKTVSKVKSDKAARIAEAGATQYMNFLNQNREVLTFDDCVANRNSDGTCPDTGSTKSWSQATNILSAAASQQGGTACTNATGGDAVSTIQSWANANNTTGWRTIGDGRFKLVGYKYTADSTANTAPGTAILAVQGINGTTATDNADGGSQVQLRVRINSNPSGTPPIPQSAPGLWARSFSTAADIHANVLDSSGCTSGNTPVSSSLLDYLPSQPLGALPNGNNTPPLSGTRGQLVKETNGTPFPPLPNYPVTADANTNTLSSCSGKTAYPANGDKDENGNVFNASSPPADGRVYKYKITGNCTLPSGVTFGNNGSDRIIMYIDSTLDIGNNARIATSGGTQAKVQWLLRTSDLDLGGNSQVGSASPTASTSKNWSFFLYSCTDVACSSRKSAPEVSLRGTPDYYAFIFAPYATADMRGNPKLGGALWVNRFETNGAPPKVFQSVFQSDFNTLFSELYDDTGTDTTAFQTASIGDVVTFNKASFNESVVAFATPTSSPTASPTPTPTPTSTSLPSPTPTSTSTPTPTPTSTSVPTPTPTPTSTSTPAPTPPPTPAPTPTPTPTPMCTVPSLVGRATNNASRVTGIATLVTNAGLVPSPSLTNSGNRVVQSQNPAANASVPCGSTVSYVLND